MDMHFVFILADTICTFVSAKQSINVHLDCSEPQPGPLEHNDTFIDLPDILAADTLVHKSDGQFYNKKIVIN